MDSDAENVIRFVMRCFPVPGEFAMQVSSSYAGSSSKPLQCEVTWRHAMNYAAAIGDDNPWYFDDEREGGIIAPPMLSVALTWPFGQNART